MSKTTQTMKVTAQTATTVVRGTSGFVGFIWRHRVGLGPFLAALIVMFFAVMLGWLAPSPAYGYGTILLTTTLLLIATRFGVSDREGKTHANRDRWHFYISTIVGATLATVYYAYILPGAISVSTGFMLLCWATGVLGAPWWWNLRRRSRVKLENDLDAWPIVTEKTKLAATWWSGYKKTPQGWTGLLHIPGNMSRRQVLQESELIEGLTKSPADSITIEPAGRNSNLVRVTCIETDPHAESINWDGKVLRSIKDLALLGYYADGAVERTRWFENGIGGFHRLLGGVTRSGKSGLMHLLCALYGPAEDVVLWGIDLKGGTALLPWAPMFDWIATTEEEAMFMMLCAEQLVNARAATLGRRGVEVIPVGPDMPAVILFCDEISSLIGDSAPMSVKKRAAPAMVEIGKKGAGMGVFLTLATQYPTLAALNNSQLKSQLGWRACFRLAEPGQGHYILPNMHKGVDPYRIPVDRRGTCYIDSQGAFRFATLRVVYFNHEKHRRGLVEKYWDSTPEIDQMSLKWRDPELIEVYKKRTIWTPAMLDRVANDEMIEGETMVDLYDDSDDVDGDGVVTERDRMLDEGVDPDVLDEDPDAAGALPMSYAVSAYAEEDAERAAQDTNARATWLADRQKRPEMVARKLYDDALRASKSVGVSPRELMKTCGQTELMMHQWLEQDVIDGRVSRASLGRYVFNAGTDERVNPNKNVSTQLTGDDFLRFIRTEHGRTTWLAQRNVPALANAKTAKDVMYEACVDAWPVGISPNELAQLCGKSLPTIHRMLMEDAGALTGVIKRIGHGRYTVEPTSWMMGPDGASIQVSIDSDHDLDQELGRSTDQ